MKNFSDLTEQELLALAIALEEESAYNPWTTFFLWGQIHQKIVGHSPPTQNSATRFYRPRRATGPSSFFRMSRSFRSRSKPGDLCRWVRDGDAGLLGRNAGPAFRPPRRQLRNIDGAMPDSAAICVSGRPLLATQRHRFPLEIIREIDDEPAPFDTFPLPAGLAKVSTNTAEAH